jgi:hypothetical protein
MAIFGVFYWFVDRQPIAKNIFRHSLFAFSFLTFSLCSVLTFELLGDYKNQLVFNDTKYRLEETGRAAMNPCTLPTLFVKESFYERKYVFSKEYCITKSQIKNVEVKEISANKVLVTYFLTDKVFKEIPNPLNVMYNLPF